MQGESEGVGALIRQRDEINKQLNDLSGIIDALGVPEHRHVDERAANGADHSGEDTASSETASHIL